MNKITKPDMTPSKESKYRYCANGCGSHTKAKQGGKGWDSPDWILDSQICPWCCTDDMNECSKAFTGHTNHDSWVKGETLQFKPVRERIDKNERPCDYCHVGYKCPVDYTCEALALFDNEDGV